MKIAIVTDTHFGFKNDSQVFLEAYLKFFEQQFFPYIKQNGIDTVIHMGDVLDRRKFINFNTLNQVRRRFAEWFKKNNVKVHCVIGNHDCYWKNTNDVNSVREIFDDYFNVYEDPSDVHFDGMVIGFVPWISPANRDKVMEYLRKSNADLLVGHFELDGYEVSRGINHEGGMSPTLLSSFKKVYSGHFHCKQEMGNIHYLGTAYDMFFSDVGENKGFHVLDTDTGVLEFVPNPKKLFMKISYDGKLDEEGHGNFNFSKYKDSFVKVVVTSKKNVSKFELFCDKLFDAGIHDLLIMESLGEDSSVDDDIISEKELSKNTVDLIDGYIDELKIDGGYELKNLMRELYTESLSL